MLIFYLRVLDCLKHAGGCEDLSYKYCGLISTVVAFDLLSATFDPPRLPGASLIKCNFLNVFDRASRFFVYELHVEKNGLRFGLP